MALYNEVIEALRAPDAYDEDVEEIELLQTHISYVFLTGDYVYKVKKPVDFGFLDFTTLERRKFYCEEELRVNRRLCEDMYLGVVSINRSSSGKIKIGGEGETVEYAVKMRQMPQERMMTGLLLKGEIGEEVVDEIARLLAEFHETAATGEGVDEYGSAEVITKNWVQNFDQTRELRGSLFDAGEFDFIEKTVLDFIEDNKAFFENRIKEHRIRECHGDVHSGNIFVLSPEEVYIFDAIEFYKAFSCSDVASEIAFLAMDMDFHGRSDLSSYFVDRYIGYSGDEELLFLLPSYKCYRAYVRAKVTSFRLAEPSLEKEERGEVEGLTKRYFTLALRYARSLE